MNARSSASEQCGSDAWSKARTNATYATDVRNQDLGENPCFSYPPKPVDKWNFYQWRTSDEGFAEFLEVLQTTTSRRRQLWREGRVPIPARTELARGYQDKTDQLCRLLAVERRRPDAGAHFQDSSIPGGSFVLEEGMK